MNALTLTLIRLAFLAVLWLFVIAAVGVVRTDLFGHLPCRPRQGRKRQQARSRPAQPAKPPRPGRASRAAPQQLLVTGGRPGRNHYRARGSANHYRSRE